MPISRVQAVSNRVTGATSIALALPSNVTAGNAVIIAVGCTAAVTPTFTASDSLGNTYTMGAARNTATRTNEIGYFLALPSGGACTVTVSSSLSTNLFGVAVEVSGLAGSGQPDASSTTSNAATTTHNAAASGQLDTVTADCFLIAIYASGSDLSGGTVSSTPSAWTEEYDNSGSGGRFVQSVIVSSAQTDNPCVMTSTATVNTGACVAAFKMAASSASGPVFGRGRTFDNSRTMGGSLLA